MSDAPRLNITIHGQVNGYAVEVCYAGTLESLPAAVQRFKAAGIEPTTTGKTSAAALTPRPVVAQRRGDGGSSPYYDEQGTPCCPIHERPLKEGRYGLYCSAKDEQGKNGYCSYSFRG